MASKTHSARLPAASSTPGGDSSFASASRNRSARASGVLCSQSSARQRLRNDLAMHFGVLAHVERREVEAKRANAAQHPAHVEQAGGAAAILGQAARDDLQVVDQLLDALVLPRRPCS